MPLGRGDAIVQLGHVIAARGRCLVILDNFEQIVEHAPATSGRWLERASEARFLVTSRERLRLEGEVLLPLGPLAEDAAMTLFVARAAAARPGFVLDPGNEETVRQVVRLLEGLPLAIELAAARAAVMAPAQILERLEDRFRLLARGSATGRHASLRAAIDGSWDLLRPWEKAAFAQASVFAGGFTLEAAEEVLDLTTWPEAGAGGRPQRRRVWTVDVVQALVDKSLLRTWVPEGAYGQPRFGMYVSLEEYARDKLAEEGAVECRGSGNEAARRAEERHGAYYAGFGTEEAREALYRHGGVERTRALARELENLEIACRRAVARGDGETAAAAYGGVWEVLEVRGPFLAGVALGASVLDMAGLAPLVRGHAFRDLGLACARLDRKDEARAHLETSLAIHREFGNRRFEGTVLGDLGTLLGKHGRMDVARAHQEQALAIHREVGNRRSEGSALGNLGNLHLSQGRMDVARAHYEQALAIHREIGNRRFEGSVLGNLGVLHFVQGRMDAARAHYEQALAILREIGDCRVEGDVLGNLGMLCHDQGRMEEAREHFEQALTIHCQLGDRYSEGRGRGYLGLMHGGMEEARAHHERALAIHREVGDRKGEAVSLGNLGDLHLEQGRMEEARAHYERSLAISRELADRRTEGAVLGGLGRLHARDGRLEEARAALAQGERLLRDMGEGVEMGKLLCVRGKTECISGDLERARAAYTEASSLAVASGAGPESALCRELRALRDRLAEAGVPPPSDPTASGS